MPRVESIRPGDVLESNFRDYPLADLLMGILRGNLSGALEIHLAPGRRNALYFKDGVPVSVALSDVPVSLSRMLLERGALDRDTASRVEAQAARNGESESRVIAYERLVADGVLNEGVRARARSQVVQLFDVGPRPFRFIEGARMPPDVELTILQPLPIIFEGLTNTSARSIVQDFWSRHRWHRFRLAETYPRGVDPFEWGDELEGAMQLLEAPETADLLLETGLDQERIAAALAMLHFADMLELHDPPAKSGSHPIADFREPHGVALPHDQIRAALARRLDPLRNKSYFEILRVPTNGGLEAMERARRTMERHLEASGDDAGAMALRALVEEAYAMISDPRLGPRYRLLCEASQKDPRAIDERMKMEVDPKLERAIRSLRAGRASEAEYWLAWAADLDPDRRDLRAYRALISFSAASPGARPDLALLLRSQLEEAVESLAPGDRARLCLALIYAAADEGHLALPILAQAGNVGEPLTEWVRETLAA